MLVFTFQHQHHSQNYNKHKTIIKTPGEKVTTVGMGVLKPKRYKMTIKLPSGAPSKLMACR